MLKVKKPAIVIFFKHAGLCERLADSNYFYKEESVPCTNFCVRVSPLACTSHAVLTVHTIFLRPGHHHKTFLFNCPLDLNYMIFITCTFPALTFNS